MDNPPLEGSFFQLQSIKEVGSLAIVHRGKPIGKVELDMAKALGERVANHLTDEV